MDNKTITTTRPDNECKSTQIAFMCRDCKKINIFPVKTQDGHSCIECDGFLIPLGYVAKKNINRTVKKLYNTDGLTAATCIFDELHEYPIGTFD